MEPDDRPEKEHPYKKEHSAKYTDADVYRYRNSLHAQAVRDAKRNLYRRPAGRRTFTVTSYRGTLGKIEEKYDWERVRLHGGSSWSDKRMKVRGDIPIQYFRGEGRGFPNTATAELKDMKYIAKGAKAVKKLATLLHLHGQNGSLAVGPAGEPLGCYATVEGDQVVWQEEASPEALTEEQRAIVIAEAGTVHPVKEDRGWEHWPPLCDICFKPTGKSPQARFCDACNAERNRARAKANYARKKNIE